MSAFPKMGYIGIKNILDTAGIRKTIIQTSAAKRTLKKLGSTRDTHTIISLDIVKFYPSVTYHLIEKVVDHYVKDHLMIRQCLRLIKFGMGNTVITFEDKYFEYDGEKDVDKKV
jgi:hypothetical protein